MSSTGCNKNGGSNSTAINNNSTSYNSSSSTGICSPEATFDSSSQFILTRLYNDYRTYFTAVIITLALILLLAIAWRVRQHRDYLKRRKFAYASEFDARKEIQREKKRKTKEKQRLAAEKAALHPNLPQKANKKGHRKGGSNKTKKGKNRRASLVISMNLDSETAALHAQRLAHKKSSADYGEENHDFVALEIINHEGEERGGQQQRTAGNEPKNKRSAGKTQGRLPISGSEGEEYKEMSPKLQQNHRIIMEKNGISSELPGSNNISGGESSDTGIEAEEDEEELIHSPGNAGGKLHRANTGTSDEEEIPE
jgi:hypothetical protein